MKAGRLLLCFGVLFALGSQTFANAQSSATIYDRGGHNLGRVETKQFPWQDHATVYDRQGHKLGTVETSPTGRYDIYKDRAGHRLGYSERGTGFGWGGGAGNYSPNYLRHGR